MRVEELIHEVLGVLRNQHYQDRIREYKRDETGLIRAIARYGYECDRRGWEFDAEFIRKRILEILHKVKISGADVRYWPVYLTQAIDQHIRERAEELNAEAKSLPRRAARVISGVKAVAVVEKTDAEVLAALYKDLRRRPKAAVRRMAVKQSELF